MMDSLRSWLLGIIFTAFASGLALEIVPKGQERFLVKMVCGLLAALAILRPVEGILSLSEELPKLDLAYQTSRQAEDYRLDQEKVLATIIAEKIETYIWDKANEQGLECTVRVEVTAGEGLVPLPDRVELDVQYDPVLAEWIEEVVGIPAEKQVWQEERVWESRAESD